MAPSTPVIDARAPSPAQRYRSEFERAMPRIRLHADIAFRDVRCVHKREDYIAEVIALSWKWWLRLRSQGKDPLSFVSAIANFAARAVRSGRRLTGQDRAKDVLSPRAQARCGFTVISLPDGSSLCGNVFDDALCDNTQTPVDEQVAFRLDRSRRIIFDLMAGERTNDISRKYGTSPGRVSQLRREFHHDWHAFLGDLI
jgi:hypothetical protein